MTKDWEATLDAHRGHQRDLIQQSAVQLVTEHGVAGVGMVDLARRAGISRATLYKYFSSVEAVLASFMISEVEREHAALEEQLSQLDDPLDRLHAVLSHLLAYFASPGHVSASTVIDPHQFSPAVGRQVGAAMQRLHDMVRDQIVAAVDAGALRDGTDVDVLSDVFQHLLTAGRTLVVDRHHTPEHATDVVWTQFLHGAASPG